MLTIYHNPRCSKSREALAVVQAFASAHALPLEIIEYLKTPPTRDTLQALAQALQATSGANVRSMLRDNEEEYSALQLAQATDDALLDAVVQHPKLLQRPLIVWHGKARIARPVEGLQEWLQANQP